MKTLALTKDIKISEIFDTYDFGLFASGYESRAINTAEKIGAERFKKTFIFGFKDHPNIGSRDYNNNYFITNGFANEIYDITSSSDTSIIEFCEHNLRTEQNLRILIDYSSMSRSWYSGFLNWIRFASSSKIITVDFIYSPAKNPLMSVTNPIKEILCIPGCEGYPDPTLDSIAIFGLGFDSNAPLALLEYLEPNKIYTFYPDPGVDSQASKMSVICNNEFISESIGEDHLTEIDLYSTPLSIASVEQVVRHLTEVISPYTSNSNIVIIPFGPKTHVLASILTSMLLDNITCLYAKPNILNPIDLAATGDIWCTRVIFE